jgi:hypothetical protein
MGIPVKEAFASKPFQVFLIVAAIVAVIFFVGKAVGTANATKPLELPDNGSGIPKGWRPEVLAEDLHDKLSGVFTLAMDKEVVFRNLLQLTNDQLVAVYNTFNHRFGKETMTQWIENEFNVSVGGVRPQLLARLRNLRCI